MTCLSHVEPSTRVLAIGAHPDDLEVGAGGLLARLADRGARVTAAVVSLPTLFEQRAAEARRGAEILGAEAVLLSRVQQRVEDVPMHQLVAQLDMLVGDLKPGIVITHSAHDLHWDHGLVNRATISALRRWPCNVLAYLSSYEMNVQARAVGPCFADVTGSIDRKLEAISAHRSQLPKLDLSSTRDLARAMGRLAGVEYAEAFEVLRLHV